jgi:hypothetical protein
MREFNIQIQPYNILTNSAEEEELRREKIKADRVA